MIPFNHPGDLDFLLNKALLQVCFDRHQVQLRFDDNLALLTEGTVDCFLSSSELRLDHDNRSDVGALSCLLNKCITSFKFDHQTGNLSLEFDGGSRLQLWNSNVEHESYQISFGDKWCVV
jgi:hypothetical protein